MIVIVIFDLNVCMTLSIRNYQYYTIVSKNKEDKYLIVKKKKNIIDIALCVYINKYINNLKFFDEILLVFFIRCLIPFLKKIYTRLSLNWVY